MLAFSPLLCKQDYKVIKMKGLEYFQIDLLYFIACICYVLNKIMHVQRVSPDNSIMLKKSYFKRRKLLNDYNIVHFVNGFYL